LLCFFENRADCLGTCWGKSLVVNPPCGGRRRRRKAGRTKEYYPQRWLSQRIISCGERERERERENVGFLLCSAVRVQVRVFRIWLHKVSRFDEPWREDHNISHLAYRHRLGSQIYKVSISWLLYFVIMLAGAGCRLVSSLIFIDKLIQVKG